MPKLGLFDGTVGLMERVMDLRTRSQQVIASNIANAETPGYAAARLEFEQDLKQALAKPKGDFPARHPGHIPVSASGVESVEGRIVRKADRSGLGDGNGVNLDDEMMLLSENQLMYQAATQMIGKKLALLKYAAQDGK